MQPSMHYSKDEIKLHNVSKTELTKGICSVAMYNRYLSNDAVISLDKFEKLVSYFGMNVTISL